MLEIQEESISCTSLFTPVKIESIISFNFGHLHRHLSLELRRKERKFTGGNDLSKTKDIHFATKQPKPSY